MQTNNPSASNDIKIQKIISNIFNKEAIFQNGHWSSAVNFERWLQKDGYIPACPISYQYKFPDGISEADYEKKIMNNLYYFTFDSLRIENPEQYIELIYQNVSDATVQEKQNALKLLNEVTGTLDDDEKRKIITHFTNPINKSIALQNINYMVREIKQLNPVLSDIPVASRQDAEDLLIGVTSKFHPEDIKYFITESRKNGGMEKINQDQQILYTVLGYLPHLFISPSRARKIANGIILQKQHLGTQKE